VAHLFNGVSISKCCCAKAHQVTPDEQRKRRCSTTSSTAIDESAVITSVARGCWLLLAVAGCCWLLMLLPTCGLFTLLMLSWPQLQLGRFRHRLGCGLLVLPPGHL